MFDVQWMWISKGLGGLINMMIGLKDVGQYIHEASKVSIESDISRLNTLVSSKYYIDGNRLYQRSTGKYVSVSKCFGDE